jgi:hypothetical protein
MMCLLEPKLRRRRGSGRLQKRVVEEKHHPSVHHQRLLVPPPPRLQPASTFRVEHPFLRRRASRQQQHHDGLTRMHRDSAPECPVLHLAGCCQQRRTTFALPLHAPAANHTLPGRVRFPVPAYLQRGRG